MPEDIEDADELADDMTDTSVKYADAMLAEFEQRFAGGGARRRTRKTKKDETEDE